MLMYSVMGLGNLWTALTRVLVVQRRLGDRSWLRQDLTPLSGCPAGH